MGHRHIGRATAIHCALAGMPVVLAARREDRLRGAVEEIEASGGRALALACDVTDKGACANLVDQCIGAFGSVYAVFANAGYGFEQPVHEVPEAKHRAIFEANYWGTMNVIEPAIPRMLDAGRGHILICSSCLARLALPYNGPYCATKAAQALLGQAMRVELRRKGVRVSTVHPIGTKTELFETAKKHSPDDGANPVEHAPQWLMQSADTVAKAIVRCLRRPHAEVWPTWACLVRFGMGMCVAFPRLSDFVLNRMVHEYERQRS